MKHTFSSLVASSFTGLALFAACGSSQGGEGAACYPNGTCDSGLVCAGETNTCKSVDSSGTGGGSGVGIDVAQCLQCGNAACTPEQANCEANPGCTELLSCTLGCGIDVACKSGCSVNGLTQEQAIAATMAVGSYMACAVPACPADCALNVGTGGATGTGGADGSGTGGADGSGTGGGTGSGVVEACLGCGDTACPGERADCDGVKGCADFIECGLSCGSDQTCADGCTAGLSPDELSAVAVASVAYLDCTVTNCASECGAAGTGGSSGSGGSSSGGSGSGGSSSGGASTGGSSSGGASTGGSGNTGGDELFTGTGVGIDVPTYGALGSFFVLEDGVADGSLIVDSLDHTDLDPPDSDVEPSTFESSIAPCVSGVIAVVTDADGVSCELTDADCVWGDLWGGGIGLTLNELDGTAMAWDADAAGVTGFKFQTSGSIDGVPMRFFVEDTSGRQFCKSSVASGSTVSIKFSSLENECWDPTGVALDPSKIKQISWQFVPDASSSYTISNFCIENLSVLR